MSDPMTSDPQFPEAELARLADDTLPPERQSDLRARVQQSPALQHALAEQQRAVAMIRAVDVAAPAALRARLEEMTAADQGERLQATGADGGHRLRASARGRWRPRFGLRLALPLAGGLAAAAVLAIVLIPGGGASGPTLAQTARVALAAATAPAPTTNPAAPSELRLTVAGIPFPNWSENVGWQAVGRRSDTLAGRHVQTVFYAWSPAERVGYAIVPGSPVPVLGGRTVVVSDSRYTLLSEGSARVVTWVRAGHTCVLAGRGVPDRILLRLALDDSGTPLAS